MSKVNEFGSNADFIIALKIEKILQDAANKIADLDGIPRVPHPMDFKK